jgi:peptide/nickel transport system substrate-binding protein
MPSGPDPSPVRPAAPFPGAALRLSRRRFLRDSALLGIGVSSLGTLIAACSSDGDEGGQGRTEQVGGELVAGVVSAIGKFDPHGWSGFSSNIVTNHVYQGLVRLNFTTNAIEPAVAESWENPDPQTWTFNLREGVTFHDGSPVTAEDVVFTTERSKKVSWGAYALSNLESVRALDDRTVQVKLTNPDWRFQWFYYWPPGAILSKAYFDKVGEEEATAKPVGTNAFKFVSATSSEVVLEKYENYWEEGLPKLDKVTLKVLDGTTIVSGLRTDELQLSPQVAFDQIQELEGVEGTTVRSRVGPHIMLSYFNLARKPFDEVKVRQAIAEAMDNAAALSAYPTQYIEPSKGAIIHSSFKDSAFEEANAIYTGNLDKARSLLGQTSVPDGFSTTWIVAADRPQEVSVVLGAKERLAQIGIDVRIQQLPDPDVAAKTFVRPQEFDIITYNWLHNMPTPLDPMAALFTSKGPNFPGYKNAAVEKLVDEIIVATDEQEITQKLRELHLTAVRDAPLLAHGWDGVVRVESGKVATPEQTLIGQWDDWFRTAAMTS